MEFNKLRFSMQTVLSSVDVEWLIVQIGIKRRDHSHYHDSLI